ncbi:Glycosyl hydrolase family protein [Euphorbia peplus]|nr:Glycosyl hydrolase family protein [Euphorbia peplus]
MGRLSIPIWGFLLLCCLVSAEGGSSYVKYKDPKKPLGARIRDLMGRKPVNRNIPHGGESKNNRKVAVINHLIFPSSKRNADFQLQ